MYITKVDFDVVAGDGVIVLRDVTEGLTPFSPIDHYCGLTLCQVMSVVDHVSAIHAAVTSQLIKGTAQDRFEHLQTDPIERLEAVSTEMSNLLRLFGRFLRIVPGYREQAELFEKYRSTLVSMLIRSLRSGGSFGNLVTAKAFSYKNKWVFKSFYTWSNLSYQK